MLIIYHDQSHAMDGVVQVGHGLSVLLVVCQAVCRAAGLECGTVEAIGLMFPVVTLQRNSADVFAGFDSN